MNMCAAMIYQIIAIICGLITPRLILSNFGSTYNGVVSSATQFLSMISILTLGITGATRVALYKTLNNNDVLGTSRIMKATKNYMRKVALCVIVYASILCFLYPFISHNDLTNAQNALLILIVSIGMFAQYFFGISNQTLLQADQASYVTYALDILKTIANTICVAILIKLNMSIYIVKLGSSIVFLFTPAIMNLYVKKKYKLIDNCKADYCGIKQRRDVAIHSIANLIHGNIDLILLTIFVDAKIISVYTVYYLVVGKIKSLIQVVTSGMEAAFGSIWVKKELKTLEKNFRGFEYLIYTFTVIVFSCVGILILPFIERYTAGISDIEYIRLDLAILITLAEGVFCIRQPYVILVQATGNYKETRNGALIEAILNLIISLMLVNFIGISGVIVGTLVANIFRTMQYTIFISNKVLHRNINEVLKRILWTVSSIGIICFLALIVVNNMIFNLDWSGWIIESVIVFSISCCIALIMSLIFYRKDLIFIINIIKRISIKK
ncbi:MAG: lipopolysaccharide biosynthesis protein [Clostridium paraputrificum]